MCQYLIYFEGRITFHCVEISYLFIRSSVGRLLDYFHFLPVMNNAPMNIHVQLSVWTYVCISRGSTLRNGIARSYGNSIFSPLRNCQAISQNACTIVCSHQQCMRVPTSLYPHQHQHLLVSDPLDYGLPTEWEVSLFVVLVCMSLRSNDIKHLFICFWPFV